MNLCNLWIPLLLLSSALPGCRPTGAELAGSHVIPHPVPASAPEVRYYRAAERQGTVAIDGRLDDSAWATAPWSPDFVDIEGSRAPAPRYSTRIKLMWDSTALYIGARLEDPDLWGTLRTRDTVIFLDNDFEVFLDPDGDTHHYYEMEINQLGTVWDLLLVKPYRDGGPAVTSWDVAGLRSAVHLEGTINQPADRDSGWTVELAIPWKALGEPVPSEGARWRVNFSRVQWTLDTAGGSYHKRLDPHTGKPLPEANWVWSPQLAVNMHMPEMWGVVEFTTGRGAMAVSAPVTADDRARWTLRRVYYAERARFSQMGSYSGDLEALGLKDGGQDIHLELTVGGWQATLPSGSTPWHIRQDGLVWADAGGRP